MTEDFYQWTEEKEKTLASDADLQNTGWYVTLDRVFSEENICVQCRKLISDGSVLERCFIPWYEEKKTVSWTLEYSEKNLISRICVYDYTGRYDTP